MTARSSAPGIASPVPPAKATSSHDTAWTTPGSPSCLCGTRRPSSAIPKARHCVGRGMNAGYAIWRSGWEMRRRRFRCSKHWRHGRDYPSELVREHVEWALKQHGSRGLIYFHASPNSICLLRITARRGTRIWACSIRKRIASNRTSNPPNSVIRSRLFFASPRY